MQLRMHAKNGGRVSGLKTKRRFGDVRSVRERRRLRGRQRQAGGTFLRKRFSLDGDGDGVERTR